MQIDRRDFLAAGVGGLATISGLATTARGADEKRSGLKIAVKYYMVGEDIPMVEKFKLLKSLGFDAIELDSPNNYGKGEVKAAIKESGLPVHGVVDSVHWNKPLSDPNRDVQKAGVDGLLKAIDDAKEYGASTVLLVPAVVNPNVSYAQAWERSQANIKLAIPYAEKQGIRIGFENVWNKFLLSPLEFARYIDELESPVVGAYFDVGNIVEFGFPQEWIRVLGKRIIKLDIKEYGRKERFNYKLGEGDVDWKAVREALAEIGFSGYCTAEIPGGNREYLADVAGRMNKILGRESA